MPTAVAETPSAVPTVFTHGATLQAFTRQEVADRLHVGLSTVIRMIDAGDLRVVYPRGQGRGRPVRIPAAELARVLGYDGGDAR